MDALDLARWQFGTTTVYHFLFVPLTIGLAFIVAGFQTAWHRTGDEKYLRLTKFYGKLFLINFALGIVTGIVQEFQFGMNWSDYSRFVGDIFGAPLAIEGLAAFFLESVFLGAWIFGWNRLPPRVHLATIWVAAFGTMLSAYFILAANSFMQNPVGFVFNETTGRAELADFWAMLTNQVALITFPHTILAAFLTSGAFVLAVALWHLMRRPDTDAPAFRSAARAASVVMIISAIGVTATGDVQAKVMTEVQPMKMAAAEALWDTTDRASFSLFTIGSLDGTEELFSLRIPGLLSYLAEGSFDAEVQGINDLQSAYELKYGPGDYTPNIWVTYWSFRLMMGIGLIGTVMAFWTLWVTRRGRTPEPRNWVVPAAIVLPFLPLLGNSFGWIFTEMGRQPWIVFGLMPTASGVSPGVSTGEVLTTLIGFTLLYGLLAYIEIRLMLTAIRAGLPEVPLQPPRVKRSDGTDADSDDADADDADADDDRELTFAY